MSTGLQAKEMDMSLREPEAQMNRREDGALSAGLVDPDKPIYYSEEDLYRLRIRKKLEYELIKRLDKSTIVPRQECWFLVDSKWLNQWAKFVHLPDHVKKIMESKQGSEIKSISLSKHSSRGIRNTTGSDTMDSSSSNTSQESRHLSKEEDDEDNELPGPISSKELVDENGIPLIADLQVSRDYRGVPAVSYFCFVELYGKDNSPDIPRYQVDIYKPVVPVARLVNIQFKARQEAKLAVAAIRPKWMKWELSDDEDDEEDKSICCGLTREHIETFIWWFVRCCFVSRRKDGRAGIKYREYKPMMYKPGDSTHGLDSSHGSSAHSTRGSRHGGSANTQFSHALSTSGRDSSNGHTPINPMHLANADTEEGIAYADRNYDAGRWVFQTRVGSWLSSFL